MAVVLSGASVHGRGSGVIKTFRALADDPAADESFKGTKGAVIFRGDKADRFTDSVRATGAANAVHIILGVHWKIVVYDVRDAFHVNPAGRNVGGDENSNCA